MKNICKSLGILALFIAILVLSVYGVKVSPEAPVKAVGALQLAPFKNGLSYYQGYKGLYHTFSPFNDYELLKNGEKSTLISLDEATHSNYKSSFPEPEITLIGTTLLSYLHVYNPHESFKNDKKINYTTVKNGNKLVINRSVVFPVNTGKKILGSTLSYNAGDYIFDESGNLYTYVDEADIAFFKKEYGIQLTPKLDDLQIKLPSKKVYVFNPRIAAALVLTASQVQTIHINRNSKVIQVEEQVSPIKNRYETSITTYVFNNPKEALNAL